MKNPAKLVSIEGINFAGKTTQTNLLERTLMKEGHNVCSFKFPDYTTHTGKLLHRLLYGDGMISVQAIFSLFSTNRLELKPKIEKARTSSRCVLFDRYSETEYAYGLAKGLPKSWLLALESQMPIADLVFVLNIDPFSALERAKTMKKRDIFELDVGLLSKVRQNYLLLASKPPRARQQWEVVDASKSIERVHDFLETIVLKIL
jgi:dTMP kinase